MKKTFLSILGIFLIVTTALAKPAIKGIPFDERNWVQGSHESNEQAAITEYVPEGDTVEQWKELITVSEFFGLPPAPKNPESIMTSMMQLAQESCKNFKKNVIQVTPVDVLFEWETSGCKTGQPGTEKPEFDISRIIFTKDRIFIMQYASRSALAPEKRSQWIKIISSSLFNGTTDYDTFQEKIGNSK